MFLKAINFSEQVKKKIKTKSTNAGYQDFLPF